MLNFLILLLLISIAAPQLPSPFVHNVCFCVTKGYCELSNGNNSTLAPVETTTTITGESDYSEEPGPESEAPEDQVTGTTVRSSRSSKDKFNYIFINKIYRIGCLEWTLKEFSIIFVKD